MNIVFVFAASMLTVLLAGRAARRSISVRTVMVLGGMATMLGVGLGQLLESQGLVDSSVALPLVAAMVAALGLASQQHGTVR